MLDVAMNAQNCHSVSKRDVVAWAKLPDSTTNGIDFMEACAPLLTLIAPM